MSQIVKVFGREILDSRGNPTVEVDVYTAAGAMGRAAVPSGASTGVHEAVEMRDGQKDRFLGKGVMKAVQNVNNVLAEQIEGMEVSDQAEIDNRMIEIDGTDNKGNMGANAILGISLAAAKAAAQETGQDLYRYVGGCNGTVLPVPMMNILNGGSHADNRVDFQEFMILPVGAPSFKEALRMGAEVFHALKSVLSGKGLNTAVGDEGGYAPKVKNGNNEPLECIGLAVEKAGYRFGEDIAIAMDVAASEFYEDGFYTLKTSGERKSAEDLINWYGWAIENYPVISIEDGLSEDDWANWQKLTSTLGDKIQLVGDDLFVTNTKLLAPGIDENVANAILIKPNQIGSLSETIDAVMMAKNAGYKTVISHRSGETEDVSIAHLAVGLGAGQIKTGSLSRSERICKYNELMRIAKANPDLKLS